jgi:hypothetical protein
MGVVAHSSSTGGVSGTVSPNWLLPTSLWQKNLCASSAGCGLRVTPTQVRETEQENNCHSFYAIFWMNHEQLPRQTRDKCMRH